MADMYGDIMLRSEQLWWSLIGIEDYWLLSYYRELMWTEIAYVVHVNIVTYAYIYIHTYIEYVNMYACKLSTKTLKITLVSYFNCSKMITVCDMQH